MEFQTISKEILTICHVQKVLQNYYNTKICLFLAFRHMVKASLEVLYKVFGKGSEQYCVVAFRTRVLPNLGVLPILS